MMHTTDAGELAQHFVELNEYLHAGGEADAAVNRLVALAVEMIPGCRWAAITEWPSSRPPRSIAASSPIAQAVDDLQYELREGPCMAAASDEHVHHLMVDSDHRWPTLTCAIREQTPVRAALAFHLTDVRTRSALNLYGNEAHAFDAEAVATAALFAAHARVLLLHAESSEAVGDLHQALAASREIGAAIGILMATHKVTEEQAFNLLRSASQLFNRKLHDIARDVRLTGELPDPKPTSSTSLA